jgi:hypothetical protein
MINWTKAGFEAFPRGADGIKICPTGDYSLVGNCGEGCRFGGGCSFGERCSFEGHKAKPGNPYIAFDRSASSLRKAYFFNFEDGIYVRAGCFFGTLAEFRAAVKKAHGAALAGRQYRAFADIAQMTFGDKP